MYLLSKSYISFSKTQTVILMSIIASHDMYNTTYFLLCKVFFQNLLKILKIITFIVNMDIKKD